MFILFNRSEFNNFTNYKMARRIILNPIYSNDVPIHALIFDMDGTLCLPQTWMFKEMRKAINLTDPKVDILKFIEDMSPQNQLIAKRELERVEEKAMHEMKPQPGLKQLMEYLVNKNLKKGICTRNLIVPVNHLLSNYLPTVEFDTIITRDFQPPKPSPKPLQHIIEQWGLDCKNVIMVGDSMDDMLSGSRAGCATILIKTHANEAIRDCTEVDVTVDSLDQIIKLIEDGFIVKS